MSKPNLWQVFKSVVAAGIGVQSQKNREIDFEQGSLLPYIVVGLIVIVAFIGALVFIVSIITS